MNPTGHSESLEWHATASEQAPKPPLKKERSFDTG